MPYMRPVVLAFGLAGLLISGPAFGQNPPARGRGQGGPPPDSVEAMRVMRGRGGPPDDFGRYLFPPELVMQHQRDIGLTDVQRTAITGAIQKLESDVVAWQWKMTDEQQRLTEMVQQTPVYSTAMLGQLDKVLDLERQIKRAQVAMLIRIKNTLTADQQHVLRSLAPPSMREMLHLDYGPAGRVPMGPPDGGRGRRGGGPGGSTDGN